MKKRFILCAVVTIGIIATISIKQSGAICSDELLNANVEALAWDKSDGNDQKVDCTIDPGVCKYNMILHDPDGNVLKNAEGEVLYIENKIHGLSNLPSKAQ